MVSFDVVSANEGVVDTPGDVSVVVSISVVADSVGVVVLYAVVFLVVSSFPGVDVSSIPLDGVSVNVIFGVVSTDNSVVPVVLCHVRG